MLYPTSIYVNLAKTFSFVGGAGVGSLRTYDLPFSSMHLQISPCIIMLPYHILVQDSLGIVCFSFRLSIEGWNAAGSDPYFMPIIGEDTWVIHVYMQVALAWIGPTFTVPGQSHKLVPNITAILFRDVILIETDETCHYYSDLSNPLSFRSSEYNCLKSR